MNEKTQVIKAPTPEKDMEFIPYGASDKIKLSVTIIQKIIAVPTRSGATCSTNDAIKFMMMCQAKRLNPFEGDAFLIGFDSKDGPKFNMITAHQAFLKRAEIHPEYDGMQSGVLIENEDGEIVELDGDFHTEAQKPVGGWARVHFKNRKIHTYRRLRLGRFQKSFGVWQEDPAGMIVKCAEADALRSSFPTMLGGLYMREEAEISVSSIITDAPAVTVPAKKNNAVTVDVEGEQKSPQLELSEIVISAGFTFTEFQAWAKASGNPENADTLASFEEIPIDVAKRLLRGKTALLENLTSMKGETK